MLSILLIGLLGLTTAAPEQYRRFRWDRDDSTGFGTLKTTTSSNGAIVRLTVHNPPINLYDQNVAQDMYSFVQAIAPKAPGTDVNDTISWPKVVIISSDVENFWVAKRSSPRPSRQVPSFALSPASSSQRSTVEPLLPATSS
ncbi:hypothetical protein NQ176_g4296 [Zarea fungicola]|uniref:Uncharacterized protein n=1 Tax=Zarea fungicola TaxID=93591 RepID=A0ACC1NG43_9HYPO|nr:hypothetical protein NQ176_g4296 [Lecanicillium fungicola]